MVVASLSDSLWYWQEIKLFIEHGLGFRPDSVHVMAGALIFLAAALVFRRPVSTGLPWLIVFAFTCLNEVTDLWFERWPHPGSQYGEGVKDMLLTMFVPTLILLTARSFPWVYEPRTQAAQAQTGPIAQPGDGRADQG